MKLTKPFFAVMPGDIYPADIPLGTECPPELELAAREAGALEDPVPEDPKKKAADPK